MIIIVPVGNELRAQGDVARAAYRAWRLGRLLTDTPFRNSYKFLVARVGPQIVGTFCIHGVAVDHIHADRVKFQLEDTSEQCDQELRRIIMDLNATNPSILRPQNRKYISSALLNRNNVEYSQLLVLCECALGNIPLLKTEQISIP